MSGRVVSWTRVHRAPDGFPVPFTLALIEKEDGCVLGHVVGTVEVGARVARDAASGLWHVV